MFRYALLSSWRFYNETGRLRKQISTVVTTVTSNRKLSLREIEREAIDQRLDFLNNWRAGTRAELDACIACIEVENESDLEALSKVGKLYDSKKVQHHPLWGYARAYPNIPTSSKEREILYPSTKTAEDLYSDAT